MKYNWVWHDVKCMYVAFEFFKYTTTTRTKRLKYPRKKCILARDSLEWSQYILPLVISARLGHVPTLWPRGPPYGDSRLVNIQFFTLWFLSVVSLSFICKRFLSVEICWFWRPCLIPYCSLPYLWIPRDTGDRCLRGWKLHSVQKYSGNIMRCVLCYPFVQDGFVELNKFPLE